MRVLLVTGPGGAGTTTMATAAAVRAATGGRRTLLLSRQRAAVPGLGDVPGLRVVRVEPQAALETLWSGHVESLAAAVPQLPPASSVVALPGSAELAVLVELGRADADTVVVDAGPVEAATGLLALPVALRWWLGRLVPPQLRVLGALRAAVPAPRGGRGFAEAALAAVPPLERLLDRAHLGDPQATSIAFVAPGRRSAVPALREAATALAVHGQRPATVLVRVLPEGAGSWWGARVEEQEAVLAQLGEVAPVRPVPELPATPADVPALLELLPEPLEPETAPAAPSAPEKVAGGWRLAVPLPFAERGEVELTRDGDDLVITAAGNRRSLRLDSLLRRCRVTGGALREAGSAEARLDVTFAPDPRQWPADLLAGQEGS